MRGLRAARTVTADPRHPRVAAPLRVRGRGLRRTVGWVALAAAAALAVVWLQRGMQPQGEQVAQRPQVLPPEPVQPREPTPEPPSRVVPEAPTAEAPAAPPQPSDAPAPTPEPTRKPEPEPEPARPEPVMLAMAMPHYAAPGGETFDRMDGVLRGTGSGEQPLALSPDHVGRASTAAPVLSWYLPELPPSGAEVWLSVVDARAEETLLDVEISRPAQAGLQEFALAGKAELRPGVDYTWSVSLRTDPDQPSLDQVAFGWVRYEPVSAEDAARLASAEPGAKPALWAELGYFYDALTDLEALAREHPGDPRVRQAQAVLLRQANLDPARVGLTE
jgi:hypothetical protein